MALTRPKKKFAEAVFRNPNKQEVMQRLAISEQRFDEFFSNDEVLNYIDALYKKHSRIATATSYGALVNNVSELSSVVTDPDINAKNRIAAAREIRETFIQLQEQEANARIIAELDALGNV